MSPPSPVEWERLRPLCYEYTLALQLVGSAVWQYRYPEPACVLRIRLREMRKEGQQNGWEPVDLERDGSDSYNSYCKISVDGQAGWSLRRCLCLACRQLRVLLGWAGSHSVCLLPLVSVALEDDAELPQPEVDG